MKRAVILSVALLLSACQGSFGSGGTSAPGGVNPPVMSPGPNALPQTPTPKPSGAATTPPGDEVTYPIASAASGLKCPQDQGFSCTVTFAVVGASPSPSPSPSGSASPSPSPTPTPTPTPTPSGSPGASASPSPTPTATGPHVTLRVAGMPKDAPKMENPDPKAVATVALMTLRMHTDADVTLAGQMTIDYTIPQEQIGGRGFAVQLFHEGTKKRKESETFVGSFSKSHLTGTTLHFEINAPALQVKKDEVWLLVLYGDELPSKTPSPSPSPSGSPSAKPSPSVSPNGSASPSASPAATVSPVASPTAAPSP
jgi:hypothetical protein